MQCVGPYGTQLFDFSADGDFVIVPNSYLFNISKKLYVDNDTVKKNDNKHQYLVKLDDMEWFIDFTKYRAVANAYGDMFDLRCF